MSVIYLVSEDSLGCCIAESIVKHYRPDCIPHPIRDTGGLSVILRKLSDYNRTAAALKFFVVVDLDRENCVVEFIDKCFSGAPLSRGLLFRVAVREVESWLLADRAGFCDYFKISSQKLQKDPDSLRNPKEFLIHIINKYCKNRNYREDITPQEKTGALTGPAYNVRLIQFVKTKWSAKKAEKNSLSLRRAINAVKKF